MLRVDLERALEQRGAILRGHFRLSSGRHSATFIQKFRILEDPALLEPVARALADRFRSDRPTVVVSAAVGGILLGYEVARALGTRAVFIEKEGGVPVLRRGFHIDGSDRALVVEDVITTGASVSEVIAILQQRQAHVVGIGAIVARSAVDFGIRTHALLEMPIASYEASECPQCAAGEPIVDPGSRRTE